MVIVMKNILFNYAVSEYKNFSEKNINTKYPIIGVKTDILKKIAKDNIDNYKQYFIEKHQYYEEYMIHGIMLGYLKIPIDDLFIYIDEYINYINCWSMVDLVVSNLKIIKKYKKEVFEIAKKYINSKDEFRVRFGYCILLSYYINDNDKSYIDEILSSCNKQHNKYYIQMVVAWLISVAYVYFKDGVIQFLKTSNLDKFTYNKSISKICDSFRVSNEEKTFLKEMRKK